MAIPVVLEGSFAFRYFRFNTVTISKIQSEDSIQEENIILVDTHKKLRKYLVDDLINIVKC